MRSAPHLFNEDSRLAALAEYDLANHDNRVDLDEIVGLPQVRAIGVDQLSVEPTLPR